jgi:hypothetical protein
MSGHIKTGLKFLAMSLALFAAAAVARHWLWDGLTTSKTEYVVLSIVFYAMALVAAYLFFIAAFFFLRSVENVR